MFVTVLWLDKYMNNTNPFQKPITHTFVDGKLVNTYGANNGVISGPARAAALRAAAYRAEHGHAEPRPFG